MNESERIADQLRRAFDGQAWHGQSVLELLKDVTAEEAVARPVSGRHNIWEIVLHNIVWNVMTSNAVKGEPMKNLTVEEDWPVVKECGEDAWRRTLKNLEDVKAHLVSSISEFKDEHLNDTVPGRSYSYYVLFHGLIQHNLYHAGQIAILKRKRSQVSSI